MHAYIRECYFVFFFVENRYLGIIYYEIIVYICILRNLFLVSQFIDSYTLSRRVMYIRSASFPRLMV